MLKDMCKQIDRLFLPTRGCPLLRGDHCYMENVGGALRLGPAMDALTCHSDARAPSPVA